MRIFGPGDIRNMVIAASRHGLVLDGTLDLECGDRLVRWQGRDYTFTYLVLRRL